AWKLTRPRPTAKPIWRKSGVAGQRGQARRWMAIMHGSWMAVRSTDREAVGSATLLVPLELRHIQGINRRRDLHNIRARQHQVVISDIKSFPKPLLFRRC